MSLTCSPSTPQMLLHGPSHRGEAPALRGAHTRQGGQRWALPAAESLRLTGDSRRLGSWKHLHMFLMIWISEKSGLVTTNRLKPWLQTGRGTCTIGALHSRQWPGLAGPCVWDWCWQSSPGPGGISGTEKPRVFWLSTTDQKNTSNEGVKWGKARSNSQKLERKADGHLGQYLN